MTTQSMLLKHPSALAGCCPSCHHSVTFKLIGVQTWPLYVTAKTHLPPQEGLYECPMCTTSVSETSLVDARSA